MKLPVYLYGHPVLRKTAETVAPGREGLKELLENMYATMYASEGVGLAAPQIGILRRAVIVMDDEDRMLELVNPEIIHAEGEQEGWEGCLSVPNQYGWVNRPSSVTVRAQDRDGNFFEVSGEEMVARCFCHELEHLEGHLFVERTDGQLYTMEELDAMESEQAESRKPRQKRGRRK